MLAGWTQNFPEDGYTVSTLSAHGNAVTCGKGLVVEPHHSRDHVPAMAVLVHPRGDTRALCADAEHLDWLRKQRTVVPLLTSVCTGSLVYAKAGLLRDRRPRRTGESEDLTENDPTIKVRHDARWVDDGDVITAAGVSAGIDMALHPVVRLAGLDRGSRGAPRDPVRPGTARVTLYVRRRRPRTGTADMYRLPVRRQGEVVCSAGESNRCRRSHPS